jgi:hypothetical protein
MTTPIDIPAARPAPAWWTGLRDGLRNYPEFVIVWLACSAVPCLVNAWSVAQPYDATPAGLLLRAAVTSLASVGATFALAGAAVVLLEARAGDRVDLGAARERLFARASRLVPIGIALGTLVFANGWVREVADRADDMPRVLLQVMSALIALGLLVRMVFAPVAAVLEDAGLRAAALRSWRLTHRRLWRTMLLLVAAYAPDLLIVSLLRDGRDAFPMELARQLAVGLWTPMAHAMIASAWLATVPATAPADEPPRLHAPHEAV